jgi:hypothetical protein
MNCQNCNTEIDYRFLTNCAQCGRAVEPADASQLEPLPNPQPLEPIRKRLTWTKILVNLVYVFFSSSSGMILGAVGLWTGAALFFRVFDALYPDTLRVGCGTGSAIGFLCLSGGAFLGTIGGTAFAIRRPLCKEG